MDRGISISHRKGRFKCGHEISDNNTRKYSYRNLNGEIRDSSKCRTCDNKHARKSSARNIKNVVKNDDKKCELCKRNNCRIVLDHDHINMKFRGWLCYRCNIMIGFVEAGKLEIDSIVKYLNRTKNYSIVL